MLGYIRAYKPEMKFKDFDLYKGVYCSLCKEIGKRYGLIARLTLSYDFTFFAMMRMAVREGCSKMTVSHCSFNPLKKCLDCGRNNADIAYTADVSMLMMYHKLADNINDSGFFKKLLCKIAMPYARNVYKKAKKCCPEQAEMLEKWMLKQNELEQNNARLDEAAHPSAVMLSELIGYNTDDLQREALKKTGYYIGRWVYIIDAADDCADDIKTESFNPLKERYNDENFSEYCKGTLDLTMSEAVNNFKKLKIYRFYDIIANILYDGTHQVMLNILEKEN